MQHLFFECSLAKKLWQSTFQWWNLAADTFEGTNSCMVWDSAKLVTHKKAKCAWKIVISAALWTIWLSKNDAIFNNSRICIEKNFASVKVLSKKWWLISDIIIESTTSWWSQNPMGSITKSETDQMHALLQTNRDLIGFLDGSWKLKQENIQAGIGGYIQKKNEDVIFSFSGPCCANYAFQTEWNALSHMLSNFANSKWADRSLLLYTDCGKLVCKILELFSGGAEEAHTSLVGLVRSNKVYIDKYQETLTAGLTGWPKKVPKNSVGPFLCPKLIHACMHGK